jgi:hypothetical protein
VAAMHQAGRPQSKQEALNKFRSRQEVGLQGSAPRHCCTID